MSELEGFRYRVEGMREVLTKSSIRNARLKDLRNEMVNSETLKEHFAENPRDLQLLKHDAPLRVVRAQRHLAHVPGYLLHGSGGGGGGESLAFAAQLSSEDNGVDFGGEDAVEGDAGERNVYRFQWYDDDANAN